MSQWLGWTDAIALSAAMDGGPATGQSGTRINAVKAAGFSAEEGECTRVRAALVQAIAAPLDTTTDFSPYRRRYLARQQAMETGIGPLRGRLRAKLAARSPAMARLAAMDAVMEQALRVHEDRLLATVPSVLEKHFVRLRQAAAAPQEPDDVAPAPTGAWLDVFRKDMNALLLAELDIRFQPVEGLLEALRSR